MKEDNNKIIPFPNLEQRLFQKGLDLLENNHINEAINYLLEAKRIDDENENIYYTLIAAYMKQGNLQKARKLSEEMLQFQIGDEFQTQEIYITILFQMHDYETIGTVIERMRKEKTIPTEKLDQFNYLLDLSEAMLVEERVEEDDFSLIEGTQEEIINRIARLTQKNIGKYEQDIEQFLASEKSNPLLKTILLNTLKEISYKNDLTVAKFGHTININIFDYEALSDVPFIKNVKTILESTFENDYPSIVEFVLTIADQFFFAIYPLEKRYIDEVKWSAALAHVVSIYMQDETISNYFLNVHQVDLHEIEEKVSFILLVDKNFQSQI
ncbi:tetratricopeptide repeat protein [Bacillus kwashiorkori]|uniref:tetratricopeptide repeat protein n=1 Tax=Bacillus kwashiorkori TaxID=1522318 RepID=UPI000784D3C7|nr:tetratricopeptide repeat protein [Bacillus kwashiorkori]